MAYFPPYLDASGLHLPTYEDRLQDLCTAYRSIFGQEAELSSSVPDYQLLSVFAKALDDVSALALSVYNSRNPFLAAGQSLDLLLPLYGLTRSPGETDASCRARMQQAMASRGVYSLAPLEAEIRSVSGVTRVMIRENDTDSTADGIPAHTLACYVSDGNAVRICEAINRKKPPGVGTFGTLSRNITDEYGRSHTIRFSRPLLTLVTFRLSLRAYAGFDAAAVTALLKNRLLQYVEQELDIGESINVPRLYGMLYQAAGDYAPTFALTDLSVSSGGAQEREKLTCAWNGLFGIDGESSITVEVT